MSAAIPTRKGSRAEMLIAAYPSVADRDDGEQAISAMTGIPLAEVDALLADPEVVEKAEAARIKAEIEGKTLAPLVNRTAYKLLKIIHDGATGMDAHEAAELLRPVSRVMSDLERTRIAEREKDASAGLPVFNFVFNNGGVQATHVVCEVSAGEPVIDATAASVIQPAPVRTLRIPMEPIADDELRVIEVVPHDGEGCA